MKHLFIVGFAGVGKTYHGQKLAKKHQMPFTDLDAWIEKYTGKTIPEIFSDTGETGFRKVETESLIALIASLDKPTVISTGGGTPCFNHNMERMKSAGIVIYMKAGAQKIQKNLKKSTKSGQIRPLFLAKNGEITLKRIELLLDQRTPYYEQSHVICGIDSVQSPDLFTLTADLLTKLTE